MVKGVCLRYGKDEDEADDLLQDTFIKTFQKLEQYQGKGALGGWIRRIAVTTALEHIRKQKMILTSITTEMESVLPDEKSEALFQKVDLDELVSKIQELPVGYRTVFNLYAIEGYTHKEIAGMLAISEGTSKSQYSRARNLLIRAIKRDETMTNKKLNYVE